MRPWLSVQQYLSVPQHSRRQQLPVHANSRACFTFLEQTPCQGRKQPIPHHARNTRHTRSSSGSGGSLPGPLTLACTCRDSIKQVVELATSSGWQHVSNVDGVVYEARSVKWVDTKATRFTTTMSCTLTALKQLMVDDNKMLKIDEGLAKVERIRTVSDTAQSNTCIKYILVKSPCIGVSKRDFVSEVSLEWMESTPEGLKPATSFNALNTAPSVLVYGVTCVTEPSHPPKNRIIRGHTHVFGIIATPITGGIRVVQVMSVDPKGWIPTAAIDASNKMQIDKLNRIKDLLQKES
mmetsp:Transcript_37623/g.67111  ORF Transcript_37623/g.67111 Transcript_37623/m.67111 type:complete len:294 (-) Transcript_37623:982-1863(-)